MSAFDWDKHARCPAWATFGPPSHNCNADREKMISEGKRLQTELKEMQVPVWGCKNCGASGLRFKTVTDEFASDCDIECLDCGSTNVDELPNAFLATINQVDELNAGCVKLEARCAKLEASLKNIVERGPNKPSSLWSYLEAKYALDETKEGS